MINLDRAVRYFLRVADQCSLSRAACDLQLSESGLSRALSALEGHLGRTLFVRTGRGMDLTDAGRELARIARPAYAQVDVTLTQLREQAAIQEGGLRIAMVHTVSYYFMSELFAHFVRTHARVSLHVLARSSPDVVALVEGKKADVGLVYRSAVATAAVDVTPLFVDEMCLVSRAQNAPGPNPIDLTTVCTPLVGFPEAYALRRMLKYAGLDDRVVAVAETLNAMLQLSSAGIGSCVLPTQIPVSVLKEYGLTKTPIRSPVLRKPVVAIVHRDVPHDALARKLVSTARARLKCQGCYE